MSGEVGHCGLVDSDNLMSPVLLSKSRVSHEFTIMRTLYHFRTLAAASAISDNTDGPMSDPSIAIAEAFKHFSQATVSAVRRNTLLTILLFTHSSSTLTNKERVQD